MIKHLFKLAWNQKRTSLLLLIEIFLSFLVLCAVAILNLDYAYNYFRPLGFSYENVWVIFTRPESKDPEVLAAVSQQIYQNLRDFEEIEAVARADWSAIPYVASVNITGFEYNGRHIQPYCGQASDGFAEVMGLEPVQGRWFEEEDEALDGTPVVITERLSRELFGAEDPVGRKIEEKNWRVVGVVPDFRKSGEFSSRDFFLFTRMKVQAPSESFVIKVRPGTTVEFEERLAAKLQAMAKSWSFEVKPMRQMRAAALKTLLILPVTTGIISAFLLFLVALGLVGVMWQNVTRRTREIGIRRATGAEARQIYAQFTGEMLALTTLAVVLGVVLVLNSAVLDLFPGVSAGIYTAGLLSAAAVLYGLVIAAAFYPGWLATRVQPAQALHHE